MWRTRRVNISLRRRQPKPKPTPNAHRSHKPSAKVDFANPHTRPFDESLPDIILGRQMDVRRVPDDTFLLGQDEGATQVS